MEDFYDIKSAKIGDKQINLFGIFDGWRFVLVDLLLSSSASIYRSSIFLTGHGGSRAAEYLKEHLFENLMKHPEFMTNTRLAISMVSCIACSVISPSCISI